MGLLDQMAGGNAPAVRTMIVYCKGVDDSIIPEMRRLIAKTGTEIEYHPGFSFETIAGNLPVKLSLPGTAIEELAGKTLKTGFELFVDPFEFEAVFPPPKRTLFNRNKEPQPVISAEADARLKQCDTVLTLNFLRADPLALRAAVLTAAAITVIKDGLCYNAASRKWRRGDSVMSDLLAAVESDEANVVNWRTLEFKGW